MAKYKTACVGTKILRQENGRVVHFSKLEKCPNNFEDKSSSSEVELRIEIISNADLLLMFICASISV